MKAPTLKLGAARVEITPEWPLPLAGFGHRRGVSSGVSCPLYVRALFFEQGEGRGKRRALLVSGDLIWWDENQAEMMRSCLAEKWKMEHISIILHATHNHSGPQTSGRFSPRLGEPDPAYLDMLEGRVHVAVEQASSYLEPVDIELGRGECHMGINRRRWVGGEIEMAPNAAGPADPEVTVIRFKTPSDATKAVLVHFACHPTVTDDSVISSEFPGVAMEMVEGALAGETIAAYLQGCCGDVRPALVRDGQFYRGGETEVRRLGERLGTEVLAIMERPMRMLQPSSLIARQATLPLLLQEPPHESELQASSRQPGVVGEWAAILRREPGRLRSRIPLRMTHLGLAEGLSFLAMNGEAVAEYGITMKRLFAGRVLPLAYSNGMIGYIPTARQLEEGGYEARGSIYYFGLPASFAPSLERKIHEGMIRLVGEAA